MSDRAVSALAVSASLPHTAAQLPLAKEIADLRRKAAEAQGRELRAAQNDLTWALIDRARAVRDSLPALETALELAAVGDEEAVEALDLADSLPPVEAPPVSAKPGAAEPTSRAEPLRLDWLIGRLRELRVQRWPFEDAWALCVRSYRDDPELRTVLTWSEPAWRASYCRDPAPRGWSIELWTDEHRGAQLDRRSKAYTYARNGMRPGG